MLFTHAALVALLASLASLTRLSDARLFWGNTSVPYNLTSRTSTATSPSLSTSLSAPRTPSLSEPSPSESFPGTGTETYWEVKTNTPTQSPVASRSPTISESDTVIPEPPAEPLVDPRLAAASVGAAVGVSVLSSTLMLTPASTVYSMQLLVLAAWSPCANESLRVTFENVSAVALAFPLTPVPDGASDEGRDVTMLPRLAGLLLIVGLVVALHVAAAVFVYRWRGLKWFEAQVACFAPGLSMHVVRLLTPGVVFAALRCVAFAPKGEYRSGESSVGALALAGVLVLLLAVTAAASAGRSGTRYVWYRFTFDEGCGRGLFPHGYWAAGVVRRRTGWLFSSSRSSIATFAVAAELLGVCIVAGFLAVDSSTLGGTKFDHCRFALWPAAALLSATTVFAACASRVPGTAWAQVAVDLCLASLFATQAVVRWFDAVGSALVVVLLILGPVAALGHAYFGALEMLRWRRWERQTRQELSTEWQEHVHGDLVLRDGGGLEMAGMSGTGLTTALLSSPTKPSLGDTGGPLLPMQPLPLEPGPLRLNPWRHDPFMRVV